MAQSAIKTAKQLGLFAVAMFGFGFAMVPIYSVLCEVTGIGGRTGVITQTEADADKVDADRLVTVEFDTNVNPSLPWTFKAVEYKMRVHPGEMSEAVFVVENKSNKPVVGKAVPSVAPERASVFFNKTECFCFTSQLLEPGESKEMIVRFVVGSELPEDILIMTLSYTFFQVTDNAGVAVSDTKAVKTKI